jgi:hypothetical protein
MIFGIPYPSESKIIAYKHKDNADVRCQAFPEQVPKEQDIYTNDNDYHHHNVKRDRLVHFHFNLPFATYDL